MDGDGSFITRGDMNGSPDPWRVHAGAVLGRAQHIIHHAGWLWQALPWVVLGFIVVFLASCAQFISDFWRWPLRIMGGTLVVVLVSWWLHPWLNLDVLSYAPDGHGRVAMHVVNTGVFPVRAEEHRLIPGQDTVVHVPLSDESGRFMLLPRPALGPWGVLWVLLFCLTPLVVGLLVRLPRPTPPAQPLLVRGRFQTTTATPAPPEKPTNRRSWLAGGLVVALVVIILAMQLSTLAAFTGSITNPGNTTATRSYFTCRSAIGSQASPRPIIAYAMGTAGNSEPSLISGAANGIYSTPVSANELVSSTGCLRDLPRQSVSFDNTCLINPTALTNPSNFSLETWFRTESQGRSNGKIAGFGTSNTDEADRAGNDRNIYLDKDGRVVFGANPDQVRWLASPAGKNYADNQWHHVIITVGTSGAVIYLDGQKVANDPAITGGRNRTGYWKFGCGWLRNWRHADGSIFTGANFFNGQLQYGAVYDTVLNAKQVHEHYLAGVQ